MNRNCRNRNAAVSGLMLIEAMAYISMLLILLGCGYAAFYRISGNSGRLRLSAEDIGVALESGERWRAEIRSAQNVEADPLVLRLRLPQGEVNYAFFDDAIYRQAGTNPAVRILSGVKGSSMQLQKRGNLQVWTWELQLRPRTRNARVQPKFSFLAVQRGAGEL